MQAAKIYGPVEQWFEPPEAALDRYLLRTRHRAANDNSRLSVKSYRTIQVCGCLTLIGAISLINFIIQ